MVGDHDEGPLGAPERVHPVRHDPQGVDVEAGVGLVEDREARSEEHHLEDLVALLLAAREALVEGPAQQPLVHVHELDLLAHELHEVDRVELLVAARPPHRVDRRLHEVRVVDPRDLHRVLEREEEPALGALLGLEGEKVLAFVSDPPGRHLVAFAAGEHVAQAALARAVRPHDRVHLAGPDHEVHPVEDRIAVHGDVETGDFEKGCGHGQLGCGGARGLGAGRGGRAARARRRPAPRGFTRSRLPGSR